MGKGSSIKVAGPLFGIALSHFLLSQSKHSAVEPDPEPRRGEPWVAQRPLTAPERQRAGATVYTD